MPLLTTALAPTAALIPVLAVTSLLFLIVLGWLGARAGDAPPLRAAVRVGCLGMLAMIVTTGIGRLLGTVV
jgi:VIT1/CCC1 family predicted Fe2+/Mn2+ transporter